jgi:hypothetical protein
MERCLPAQRASLLKQKLKDYKNGKSIGFTYVSSLKALGLIPRADGKKRVSPKYLECMGKRVPRNLYTNENPSNTIPIRFKTLRDVENTIKKLERLRKNGSYSRVRIQRVAHVLEQRTRFMKGKEKHNELAKKYLKKLKETKKP